MPHGIVMKGFTLLCLFVFATAANAAAPEQHYLDLRDRHIAKFSKAKENDETTKQHDAALKELAGVRLVGPVAISGLPADGKSNADTLFKSDSGRRADHVATVGRGRRVNFQIGLMKMLVSHSDGFAIMTGIKRDMAILATSRRD